MKYFDPNEIALMESFLKGNVAERAIQTFKNHFISGVYSTDTDWPIQLWDQLTTQAVITLNMLRTSRIDPTKSAYHNYMARGMIGINIH